MSRTFTVGVRVRCWSEERHFEVFAVSPHLQARCAYRVGGVGGGLDRRRRAVRRKRWRVSAGAVNVM